MKLNIKNISNQKGFSLIELILGIVLTAIMAGVSSFAMISQLDSYSFITTRQEALDNNRYALNHISNEILHLETSDIVEIASDQIDFIDRDGLQTSFQAQDNNGELALYRGNELLMSPIAGFELAYLDQDKNETGVIEDIRRIQITVTTGEVGNEGNIVLTKEITPRNFIYNEYQ